MDVKLIRDLVYGISGSGKTSWWLRVARYLYVTRGLRTRWYLGDGGGTTISVSGADEFVEVMQYNLWDHPLETMQKICEGYWPQDPATPNSRLLPPDADIASRVGLAVYEGLSVGADYMMGDRLGGLAEQMAKGVTLNNDASFRIKDGSLTFGGNSRTHYGFTQRRILACIEATRALPFHTGWTAHERKVEDEDYKEVWMGPDVAGRVLTTKIGASFGNTLHLHIVKAVQKGTDPVTKKAVDSMIMQRRLYTRTHYDPEAQHYVKYYANTRLPESLARTNPDAFPEWMDPDPLEYYERLRAARAQAQDADEATMKSRTLQL